MALLVDNGLGLERIAREALIVLIDALNDELDVVEAEYTTLDADLAELRRQPIRPIRLEHVQLPNFVLGHRPSLIEAPIENYPNVAVMAESAVPATTEDLDHIHIFQDSLVIEIMVRSEEGEEHVNRRAWRTVEAVNRVIQSNPTLNGLVEGITSPVNAVVTDCLIRTERPSNGPRWFWQGGRLEYEVLKVAVL